MSNIFENTFKKHLKLMKESVTGGNFSKEELYAALEKVPGVEIGLAGKDGRQYDYITYKGMGIIFIEGSKVNPTEWDNTTYQGGNPNFPGSSFIVNATSQTVSQQANKNEFVNALKNAGFKITDVKSFRYERGGYTRSGTMPRSSGVNEFFGIEELPKTDTSA